MKKIFSTLTIVFLSVCFAGAEPLTLDQARLLALANSRILANDNLVVKSNLLTERTQFYSYLPELSASVGSSSVWPSDGAGDQKLIDTLNPTVKLTIAQELSFKSGQEFIQKTLNHIAVEMAQKDTLVHYFDILDAVDTAYYNLLQVAASLESAESALRTAEISLSVAEVRSANGMMNPGDYLQALSNKESKENTRNKAKRTLTSTGVTLRNLTGLKEVPIPEAFDFEAYEELIRRLAALTDEDIAVLFTSLLKTAAVNNPTLAKAMLSNQRAEKNVTSAALDYAPTLNASFTTGLNYSATNGLSPFSGSLNLNLTIPLDFWVMASNVKQKQIARDQAALTYLSTEEDIQTKMQTALLDLITNAGTVLSSRRAFEYAEKHFEYVMELFQLSQNSVSALSDASELVISNRNQLISSQHLFLLALSEIRSLGAFVEEDALTGLLLSAGIR